MLKVPLGIDRLAVSRVVTEEDVAVFADCRHCYGKGYITNLIPRRERKLCACARKGFLRGTEGRVLHVREGDTTEFWWRAGRSPEEEEASKRFASSLAAQRTQVDVLGLFSAWAAETNEAQVLADLSSEVDRARRAA